jgi:hypothetical protein
MRLAGEGGDGEGGGEGGGGGDDTRMQEELSLLAQLTCKHGLPRLKHALVHSWDVHAAAHAAELVQAVREVRHAVELLVANAEAAVGTDDAEDEAAAADAAADAFRALLMEAAARLDHAVDGTCIPPCVLPPSFSAAESEAPPAAGSVAAAAAAAAAAASRRLARGVRLLGVLGEWSELLAVPPLQELGGRLLSEQILPCVRAQLRAADDGAGAGTPTDAAADAHMLALAVCERAALNLPAAWRARPAAGVREPCSAALCAFVASELDAAVRALAAPSATAAAERLRKLRKLLDIEG